MMGASVSLASPLAKKIEQMALDARSVPVSAPVKLPCIIVQPEKDEAPAIEDDPVIEPPKVSIRDICEVICERHGLRLRDVRSATRTAPVVAARRECIAAVIKERADMSFVRVGRYFGVDHTSVIHALLVYTSETGETVKGYNPEISRVKLEKRRIRNRAAILNYSKARTLIRHGVQAHG